jgi:hypothetical protein
MEANQVTIWDSRYKQTEIQRSRKLCMENKFREKKNKKTASSIYDSTHA